VEAAFFAETASVTFFTEVGGFDTPYAHAKSFVDTARVPHSWPTPRVPVAFHDHGVDASAGVTPLAATSAGRTTNSIDRRHNWLDAEFLGRACDPWVRVFMV
jgi:hypothetical protein